MCIFLLTFIGFKSLCAGEIDRKYALKLRTCVECRKSDDNGYTYKENTIAIRAEFYRQK